MKRLAYLLFALCLLLTGCRASDCGCPMSKNEGIPKKEKRQSAEKDAGLAVIRHAEEG